VLYDGTSVLPAGKRVRESVEEGEMKYLLDVLSLFFSFLFSE
jgi:hypothetical protein